MGKETRLSPKIHPTSSNGRKISSPWIVGVVFLCLLCYLFGGWSAGRSSTIAVLEERSTLCSNGASENTSRDLGVGTLDFTTHHDGANLEGKETTYTDEEEEEEVFEPCDIRYSEYTPCEDVQRSLQFDRDRLIYRERHCPVAPKKKKKTKEKNKEEENNEEDDTKAVEKEVEDDRLRCLVPAPPGYRNPPGWPKSRDMAWYANVPHRELTVEKAIQNWIHFDGGDKFRFPGGGTMFPNGASAYIDDIGLLLPQLYDGSIRTALDTGCGVASWGAYLLDRNILTMSFAPRDTHEAQVQFALERGVPAMLGVMASKRLPYPARAFDMAHCSRCLIPWAQYDGLYLIEVDRVLRPGGYWILSGPPINWKTHWRGWQRSKEDLEEEQSGIEDVASQLCWTKVSEKGNLAIWQKPLNHINCISNRKTLKKTSFCKPGSPDTAWYTEMEACITPLPEGTQDKNNLVGGSLEKWPMRLTAIPPRISSGSLHRDITEEDFIEDTNSWKQRVAYYVDSLIPPLGNNRYRNIMDMNAGMGGFAAALALAKVDAWVMNVVPQDSKINTLGAIYERGLIGTYQDWCEAFSTYPRTYDLIHADGIFSTYQHKCDIVDILLEMDRILRPEGAVIIRDEVDVLVKVARKINHMRWKSRMADHESGPLNSQKILVAVKSYWVAENTNSTSKK